MKILVVDDDKDIRHMVMVILDAPGREVVGEAADGDAAIAAVESCHPDLVVMDYMMPVLNGAEATRRIKATHPEVDIVGFTAADDLGVQNLLAAGAYAAIDKTNFRSLLDLLDEMQGQSAS